MIIGGQDEMEGLNLIIQKKKKILDIKITIIITEQQ